MTNHLYFKGKGIHSNQDSVVKIQKVSKQGLSLCFHSIQNQLQKRDWSSFLEKPAYATHLRSSLGSFKTPEHLMAVLLGFSKAPLGVHCYGSELPIKDGSGQIFFEEIKKKWNFKPEIQQYTSCLKGSIECQKGSFEYESHSCFKVDYTVCQGDVHQRFVFDLSDSNAIEIYQNEIIPSRTFIFWDDYQKIKNQNLVLGASLDNGVLYAKDMQDFKNACVELRVKNQVYPKIELKKNKLEMECAKHKILDLIGDIALFRLQLPRLSFKIVNAGHWQNYFFIKELIHEHR